MEKTTKERPRCPHCGKAAHIAQITRAFSKEAIERATVTARAALDGMKAEERRRELYDGKAVLAEFVRQKLHASGMSKPIFLYETARHASKRKSVKTFFEKFFQESLGA